MKKRISALLAAFVFCVPALTAQEEETYGYVNIVNLIPAETPCKIEIGGKDLVPEGLKSGDDTGWFLLPVGSRSIEISHGELDEASGKLEIEDSKDNLIVIFLERPATPKKEGKEVPPKIRIKSFPTYESKGFGLRIASTCPDNNRFHIGPHKFDLKPFIGEAVKGWTGSPFEILHGGEKIGRVKGSAESGSFYVFVGTDHKGNFVTALASSDNHEGEDYLGRKTKNRKKPSAP